MKSTNSWVLQGIVNMEKSIWIISLELCLKIPDIYEYKKS